MGADAIEVDVEVENAGICFSGREVAQVYISCPQNGGAKELRRLAGFAKTRLLAPEQCQTLTICIPQKQLATFAAQKQGWVVEQGLYGVWVGNSSAAVTLCAQIRVDADTVIEQTHPICPLHQPLDELGAADAAQKEAAHPAGLPVYGFCPRPEPRPECPPAPPGRGPGGRADPAAVRQHHQGDQHPGLGRRSGCPARPARAPRSWRPAVACPLSSWPTALPGSACARATR